MGYIGWNDQHVAYLTRYNKTLKKQPPTAAPNDGIRQSLCNLAAIFNFTARPKIRAIRDVELPDV